MRVARCDVEVDASLLVARQRCVHGAEVAGTDDGSVGCGGGVCDLSWSDRHVRTHESTQTALSKSLNISKYLNISSPPGSSA